jgi:hypothetical protein
MITMRMRREKAKENTVLSGLGVIQSGLKQRET